MALWCVGCEADGVVGRCLLSVVVERCVDLVVWCCLKCGVVVRWLWFVGCCWLLFDLGSCLLLVRSVAGVRRGVLLLFVVVCCL